MIYIINLNRAGLNMGFMFAPVKPRTNSGISSIEATSFISCGTRLVGYLMDN